MREHVVQERAGGWAVIVRGTGVAADEVIASGLPESAARARAQKLNAAQMGRPTAPIIDGRADKAGCTCARAFFDAPPCQVHG